MTCTDDETRCEDCNCAIEDDEIPWDEIDDGIAERLAIMVEVYGFRTISSCQGGVGHAYDVPTIAFLGGDMEGIRALTVAEREGWNVCCLSKKIYFPFDPDETLELWEIAFVPDTSPYAPDFNGWQRLVYTLEQTERIA